MNVAVVDVLRWSRVQLDIGTCRKAARKVQPLGVSITSSGDAPMHSGQVVCGYQGPRGRVGMAWDWLEVMPNVVVMADPMCIVSNLDLVDDDGQEVPAANRLLLLNELAFSVDWRSCVRGSVRQLS